MSSLIKRIGCGFRNFDKYRIQALLYADKPNWLLVHDTFHEEIAEESEALGFGVLRLNMTYSREKKKSGAANLGILACLQRAGGPAPQGLGESKKPTTRSGGADMTNPLAVDDQGTCGGGPRGDRTHDLRIKSP